MTFEIGATIINILVFVYVIWKTIVDAKNGKD